MPNRERRYTVSGADSGQITLRRRGIKRLAGIQSAYLITPVEPGRPELLGSVVEQGADV